MLVGEKDALKRVTADNVTKYGIALLRWPYASGSGLDRDAAEGNSLMPRALKQDIQATAMDQ
jgi:hypothetical protein